MVSEVTLSPELVADEIRPVLLRLARELRKETEQLGITARQATLLWLVKRSPGLSLAELAAEEGISPPALSGNVDRLERAGFVRRVRDPHDRRKVLVEVTVGDVEKFGQLFEVARQSLIEVLSHFDEGELQVIERYLQVQIETFRKRVIDT